MNANAKPAAYETDDEFEEVSPTSAAHGTAAGGADVVSEGLLELITYATKLRFMIEELDEGEFRVVAGRLKAFKDVVGGLPSGAKARRKVGFVVMKAKQGKKR